MYPSIPQDPIVLSAGAAFVSFTKRSRKLRPFSSFSAAPYLLASLGLNVWAILGLSLSVLFRASRSFMGLGFGSFRRIFLDVWEFPGLVSGTIGFQHSRSDLPGRGSRYGDCTLAHHDRLTVMHIGSRPRSNLGINRVPFLVQRGF